MLITFTICILQLLLVIVSSSSSSWTSFPATNTPPSVRQMPMTTSFQDLFFFYGGLNQFNQPLSDLWTFNTTSLTWSLLPFSGSSPPSSQGCLWYHNNYLIQFGGVSGQIDSNSIHRYSLSSFSWSIYPVESRLPFPRRRPACSTFNLNNKKFGLLFAGSASFAFLDDLWVLDLDNYLFYQVNIIGEAPSPRQSPNLVIPNPEIQSNSDIFELSFLVFSGRSEGAAIQQDTADTWIGHITVENSLNSFSFSVEYKQISELISGNPLAVYLTSSVFVDGNFLIFGGWIRSLQKSSEFLQVLRTYNSANYSDWQWDSLTMYRNNSTFRFDSCSALTFGDRVLLFGGYFIESVENSVMFLNLSQLDFDPLSVNFDLFSPSFSTPPPSFGHTSLIVGTKMFLLGGNRPFSSAVRDNPVHYFDLLSEKWNFVEIVSSYSPEFVTGHCTVVFGTRIYQFGGRKVSTEELTNDVIIFDPLSGRFSLLSVSGTVPSPRTQCCCTLFNHFLIVYGGLTSSALVSDLFALDLQTGRWERISGINSSPWPPALDLCSLVVAPKDIPYLILLGGRDVSLSSNQSNLWKTSLDFLTDLHSIVSSTSWKFQQFVFPPSVPASNSFTSLRFGQEIFLFGGITWDSFLGVASVLKIPDFNDLNPIQIKLFQDLKHHLPYFIEFSVTAYQNSVIFYGGKSGMFGTQSAFSTLFMKNITCSDYDSIISDCEFDCFLGSSIGDSNLCIVCPAGSYGVTSYNSSLISSCVPCSPGFYSAHKGGIGIESCLPCPFATYNPDRGATECIPCPADTSCPVGSVTPLLEDQGSFESTSVQPVLPSNAVEQFSTYSRVALITLVSAIIILIVTSFFFSQGPLFKLFDMFSRQHHTVNDNPIIKRKTKLGGFYSWIYVAVACFLASSLFFEFKYDNIIYYRSLEPYFLLDQSFTFKGSILLDFQGLSFGCSHSQMKLSCSGLKCNTTMQVSSVETESTSSCQVFLNFDCYLLESSASLSLKSLDMRAFAHKISSNVSSFSSLPSQFSNVSSSIVTPEGMLLKGPQASMFTYELVPSVYSDHVNSSDSSTGYHLRFDSAVPGSVVSNNDFHYSTGFSTKFVFSCSQFALITEKFAKQTFVSFTSSVLGTVAGISGAIAFALSMTETIFNKRKSTFKSFFKRGSDNKELEFSQSNPMQSL
ncbi:hypothetical protein RCL1_001778 [Eukaryota sp. TZLM3-RCL]